MADQDQLREQLSDLAPRFPLEREPVRKKMADLLVADPPAFRGAALKVLPGLGDPGSRRCLLELMLNGGLLPACDPDVIGLDEELALTQDLLELDPQLDMRLARRLAASTNEEVLQRVLVLLNSIPENVRVLPLVIKLLRHPNPTVRSKAALVIGRVSKAPQVVRGFLAESDPRVRANAIEALWGMDSNQARLLLREAAGDTNNRVVGNALLGLYKIGDTFAIRRILDLAVHPEPDFRTTAAWVMHQTGSPRFLPALARMVRESDPSVRAWVFKAITQLKRTATAAARLPRLRVHVAGPGPPADGVRTLRGAIAAKDGREVPRLLPTSVLLWEDGCLVTDYSMRPLDRTELAGLDLLLPQGDMGDQVMALLHSLPRSVDRWQEFRYYDALGASSFLAAAAEGRHVIVVTPPAGGDSAGASDWAQALARAQTEAVSLTTIPNCLEDPAQVIAACETAYLMLTCGYEIAIPAGPDDPAPTEWKLEVYTHRGFGTGDLKLPPQFE